MTFLQSLLCRLGIHYGDTSNLEDDYFRICEKCGKPYFMNPMS